MRTLAVTVRPRPNRPVRRRSLGSSVFVGCLLGALTVLVSATPLYADAQTTPTHSTAADLTLAQSAAPVAPSNPMRVCQVGTLLDGPSSPPVGAVVISRSDNLPDIVATAAPGTTFWISPGRHTFGKGEYTQVIPKNGDAFIGAPGAVIDGLHENAYAFTQHATNVTIEYLTIENFGLAPGDNNNQGVVNHDSGTGWLIEHNTLINNDGAGLMIGSRDVVEFNCLTHNGQYGFSAYSSSGVTDIVVSNNEISYNDTYGYDTTSGDNCGCAGGGKFWKTTNAVVTGNYVHNNQDPGLWVDTDNAGFNISDNYIAHNSAEGLIYEISYNALISNNTFVGNAWGKGPRQGLRFPTTALYISESGSAPQVKTSYNTSFRIVGNKFINNWGGVILWENPNRFCSGSDDACTLVAPTLFNFSSCRRELVSSSPRQHPDYYDGCRWKTQNVVVSDNVFQLWPGRVPGCSEAAGCGFNGIFSAYGSTPPFQGTEVENSITFKQDNRFLRNTYLGPWSFMVGDKGNVATWSTWRSGKYDQDQKSTLTP